MTVRCPIPLNPLSLSLGPLQELNEASEDKVDPVGLSEGWRARMDEPEVTTCSGSAGPSSTGDSRLVLFVFEGLGADVVVDVRNGSAVYV